jgi:2-polyprenyl-3-methyl-5-hydroxy-6-metoxy-1,4-benzoquinol methylase
MVIRHIMFMQQQPCLIEMGPASESNSLSHREPRFERRALTMGPARVNNDLATIMFHGNMRRRPRDEYRALARPQSTLLRAEFANLRMNTALQEWVAVIGAREPTSDSPAFRRHLSALFQEPGIDFQKLAATSIRSLQQSALFHELIESADLQAARGVTRLECPEYRRALEEPLVHCLLRKTIVADLSFERLLRALRKDCLFWTNEHHPDYADLSIHLMVSLACQCFNNEYVYEVDPDESREIAELEAKLQASLKNHSSAVCVPGLVVYAMYKPLWMLGACEEILKLEAIGTSPDLEEVVCRQIREPLEEVRIVQQIRSFDGSDRTQSDPVRRQYEESPYPRWFWAGAAQPDDFARHLRALFPALDHLKTPHPLRILVAGCGTGWHPIRVAMKYPESSITGIDFSYASLAYAVRQARRYGLSNVEFWHGDLLEIERLGKNFDVVECYGVLHHLADAAAGLEALSKALVPGGFMRLGLYSKRGRAFLDRAQQLAQSLDPKGSLAELRRIRQQILATLTSDVPLLTQFTDFFYLSGFRDLLCHAREARFSPGEMKVLLEELGLEFVGLAGLAEGATRAYQEAYPSDPHMRNLLQVDVLDTADPALMGPIHDYWLRKPITL